VVYIYGTNSHATKMTNEYIILLACIPIIALFVFMVFKVLDEFRW